MTCDRVSSLLPALAAGELGPAAAAPIERHVAGCPGCGARLEAQRATHALVRQLGADQPPTDFAAALHKRLVAAGPPPTVHQWQRLVDWLSPFTSRGGLALALSGALLLALAGARALRGPVPAPAVSPEAVASGPVAPVFRVPRTRMAMVKIDFTAEERIEDVEFSIVLPEGLHFLDRGQPLPDRELRWRGQLSQGSNMIPVAVRGDQPGRYTIAARAASAEGNTVQTIVLEVTSG